MNLRGNLIGTDDDGRTDDGRGQHTLNLSIGNRQNLGTRKNNPVSLTIGRILGTVAENTGWLIFP